MTLSPALAYLANFDHWILWRAEPPRIASDGKEYTTANLRKAGYDAEQIDALPTGEGKPAKVPYRPAGDFPGNLTDPDNWIPYATAQARSDALGESYGAGFVLNEANDLFCLDIDDCAGADGWLPVVDEMVSQFPGAAVEISVSGKGVHVWGRYRGQPPAHKNKNIPRKLELYTRDRFIALGRPGANGDASTDCTAQLAAVAARYFAATGADAITGDWQAAWAEAQRAGVHADWDGYSDDAELLRRARRARSVNQQFGHTATFKALYDADADALAEIWPSDAGYDASSADAALAQHLAFWTGRDAARVVRLMQGSKLVREKWERADYLPRTILHAVQSCETVHRRRPMADPTPKDHDAQTPEMLAGLQYIPQASLPDHFAGCVYIVSWHQVFTPKWGLLSKERFQAVYGGYEFQLDVDTKTTPDAWKAFVESRCVHFPVVVNAAFRPELPPGEIFKENGESILNYYRPIETCRIPGDATPFTDHVAKLVPDSRDYALLMSYMAACVQHAGVKFQWAPLIQGAEGNGKTLFTRCLIYALGEQYAHMPPAQYIAEKHNAWLFGKLLVGIEDILVPGHKFEIIETLKPMITNDRLSQRAMQTDQIMSDNRANFIINSNHRDAIRKTRNDRRFAIFYTAQQTREDMIRDGFLYPDGTATDYFPRLYSWLKADGYAIVNDYLRNYPIPDDYNPATKCHRAPRTTSTDAALKESLGVVEQTILEAVEESTTGFRDGWISSAALARLLKNARLERYAPINRRRQILSDLGYVPHPSLAGGRATRALICDGNKKPRLFVSANADAIRIQDPFAAMQAYQDAQGKVD